MSVFTGLAVALLVYAFWKLVDRGTRLEMERDVARRDTSDLATCAVALNEASRALAAERQRVLSLADPLEGFGGTRRLLDDVEGRLDSIEKNFQAQLCSDSRLLGELRLVRADLAEDRRRHNEAVRAWEAARSHERESWLVSDGQNDAQRGALEAVVSHISPPKAPLGETDEPADPVVAGFLREERVLEAIEERLIAMELVAKAKLDPDSPVLREVAQTRAALSEDRRRLEERVRSYEERVH